MLGAMGDSARAVELLRRSFDECRFFFYGEWSRTYFEPLYDYEPCNELMRPKG